MNKQAVTIIVIIVLLVLGVFAWKVYAPTEGLSEELSSGDAVSDISADLEATALTDLDADFGDLDAAIDAL